MKFGAHNEVTYVGTGSYNDVVVWWDRPASLVRLRGQITSTARCGCGDNDGIVTMLMPLHFIDSVVYKSEDAMNGVIIHAILQLT